MSLLRGLAFALLLLPGAGRAAYEIEIFPPEAGRPRIVLARRPGKLATMRVVFAAGAVEDGGRRGLTRLTQHALLASNRQVDYEELRLATHAAAGRLDLETDLRESAFTLSADWRDFPSLARILAGAVLAPRLDARRLPQARARALLDGRVSGRGTGFPTLLASLVVEDGRYLNEPFGDGDSLETLTLSDIQDHLTRHFAPANATVVVTGRFDRDEMLRFLRRFRGGLGVASQRPGVNLPARVRRRAASETYLMGYPMRLEAPRDAAAGRVAVAMVEAELWTRFREAGVAYDFEVFPLRAPWIDMLLVVLPAHDPSSLDLSSYLQDTIERVRAGTFTDAQLERARSAALAQLEADDRDPEALARTLSNGGLAWHGKLVVDELRTTDRRGFTAAIAALLAADRSLFAYFGPTP